MECKRSSIRGQCAKYIDATPSAVPQVEGVCYSADLLRNVLNRIRTRYEQGEPQVLSFMKSVCHIFTERDDDEFVIGSLAPYGRNAGPTRQNDHNTKQGLVDTFHQIFDVASPIADGIQPVRFDPASWREHRIIANDRDKTFHLSMMRCYKAESVTGLHKMMRNGEVLAALDLIARENHVVLGVLSLADLRMMNTNVDTVVQGITSDPIRRYGAITDGTNFIYCVLLESMHFTTLLVDVHNMRVEYFDSKGRAPSNFARTVTDSVMRAGAYVPEGFQGVYNDVMIQRGGTQCGAFALIFLYYRLVQGNSWDQTIGAMSKMTDDNAAAMRAEFVFCPPEVPDEGLDSPPRVALVPSATRKPPNYWQAAQEEEEEEEYELVPRPLPRRRSSPRNKSPPRNDENGGECAIM